MRKEEEVGIVGKVQSRKEYLPTMDARAIGALSCGREQALQIPSTKSFL